jgi:hypothetical protein
MGSDQYAIHCIPLPFIHQQISICSYMSSIESIGTIVRSKDNLDMGTVIQDDDKDY